MKINSSTAYGLISSVELDKGGITIHSYSEKSNYISYKDISSFKVVVHTYLYTYKDSVSTKISNMQLYITEKGYLEKHFSNCKDAPYTHETTCKCNMNTLYNLLNYKKYIGNFKLSVIGPQENVAIPLRIYSRFGVKISERKITQSIIPFVLTFVILYAFYTEVFMQNIGDIRNTVINTFIPLSAFFVISLIFSAFTGYNEYKKFKIRKMLKL